MNPAIETPRLLLRPMQATDLDDRIGNYASRRVAERAGMHLDSEFERYGNRYRKFALDVGR